MNAVALAVLLLAGRLQDEAETHTIPKQERSIYVPALQKFRDAEAVLMKDPIECARRCGELLDDKSILYRETRLRIQNTDGSYGDRALFAPLQLRGRAFLEQAKKSLAARDRKEAAAKAGLAVADLDESVRKNLKSSEEFLKQARELVDDFKNADERLVKADRRMADLRKLVDQNPAPEIILEECRTVAPDIQGTAYQGALDSLRATTFEKCWNGHAVAGRCRSARASVATFGGFLTEDERRKVLAKIDEKSVEAVRRFHAEVRRLLPDRNTWTVFVHFSPEQLEASLSTPPADELDPVDLRCRELLIQMRARTTLLDAPLDEFLQALSLTAATCVESASRLDAFTGLVALVQDLARRRLEKNISGAFDDESEGLYRRREEAQRIIEKMESFATAAGRPALLSKHLELLHSVANGLPIDPSRLDDVGRELLDPANAQGLWGRTPKLAEKLENELSEMNRADGARLSRSARRKLGTYLLAAQISRLLLGGAKIEDVAATAELKTFASNLEKDGGPLPEVMNLVSPRVRDVLALLKKP